MVEFVSYTGRFPNLCYGTLTLRIDGKEVEFSNKPLCSGGSVSFDEHWNAQVEEGPWRVIVPVEYKDLQFEIEDIVNKNVPCGCCGGCI